jgi:hypothetical protein
MELSINTEEYLKRFKIFYPKTLFPQNFENLFRSIVNR